MSEIMLIEGARFRIREGKLEEVKAAMKEVVELIKAKGPWFFNDVKEPTVRPFV